MRQRRVVQGQAHVEGDDGVEAQYFVEDVLGCWSAMYLQFICEEYGKRDGITCRYFIDLRSS